MNTFDEQKLDLITYEIAVLAGCDAKMIMSKRREQPLPDCRKALYVRLFRMGYRITDIVRLVNVSHSTIIDNIKRATKHERAGDDLMKLLIYGNTAAAREKGKAALMDK